MTKLTDEKVAVAGFTVIDSTDWAVIRIIFLDANRAREILKKLGYSFTECDILLVEMSTDETMKEMCCCLLRAEININYAYGLLMQNNFNPVLAVHVDDTILATHILIKHKMILLGNENLADPGCGY